MEQTPKGSLHTRAGTAPHFCFHHGTKATVRLFLPPSLILGSCPRCHPLCHVAEFQENQSSSDRLVRSYRSTCTAQHGHTETPT